VDRGSWPGDFVKVECAACDHRRFTASRKPRQGVRSRLFPAINCHRVLL